MIQCKRRRILLLNLLPFFCILSACNSVTIEQPLFEVLDEAKTGLDFNNTLKSTEQFNLFKYMYFYNGAGIGAADFNNDGKTDLFFASNQGQNKIYLNTGELHFKDVTNASKIPRDNAWSTGVSVVDINNDGLLDIYVCRVGNYETLHSSNQLLICKGIDQSGVPFYADEANAFGLDFSGFCTQACFLDYDGDGDLDMYLLNHSIHQNGNFGIRQLLLAKTSPVSGDHMFRNEGNNRFTDVTKLSGINSSVIGYGLGIVASDINLDGYPDIYIGNDFHENDYIYINRHDGSFKDELTSHTMHTSQYSMGVDVADINNDGFPEIISMDMLPSDPYILKRSLGEDTYDLFNLKIKYGYSHQYTRNNLQFNRKNGMFSEIGLYAGVASTDWSWAPLFMDFDNDGLKDLFISNGIPKRMNDIDYINYISDRDMQEMIRDNRIGEKNMSLISKFPVIKIPNKFYKNTGELSFKDMELQVKGDRPTFSNGAVYADFDNDGDLDVVVNNIDDPALLYQNKSSDGGNKPYLELTLKGPTRNIHATGAKVIIYANKGIRIYEKNPVRGFLSSMETSMHIGLDKTTIDSMFLVWPDNSYEQLSLPQGSHYLSKSFKTGLPKFDYHSITGFWKNATKQVTDITGSYGLKHLHHENPFVEFDREPLIPHMVSTEGPALAIADVNHDGLEDMFIGSSKGGKSAVFVQAPSASFFKTEQAGLDKDSIYEDVDACWVDVNKDGNIDLVVATGGNEYYGQEEYLTPRVYLNDGKAVFNRLENAFGPVYMTASCIVPYDFNGDGFEDLFIGGRAVPWNYGEIPTSYLMQNDGNGKFRDVTSKYAKELSKIGMVTNAKWFDLDKDGDKDLLICCEWGGIDAFINDNRTFTRKALTAKQGWWNFIMPCDINNDGNIDLLAGNLGMNSRLKTSGKEPVRLYYNDFDGNGKKDQVLTYYLNGREIPFASKAELEKQMPVLKKRFLYAKNFAEATLEDLFSKDKLREADVLYADYFLNSILVNKGNLKFELQALPFEAQFTSYRDAAVIDANGDKIPDILLTGNFYENNIELGRNDADFGTILVGRQDGKFNCEGLNGLQIKGQVRHIKKIRLAQKQDAFVVARNNDSTMLIRFHEYP